MALSVVDPYREQVYPAVYAFGTQRSRSLGSGHRNQPGATLCRTWEVGHGRTVAVASTLEIIQNNSVERQRRSTYKTAAYIGGVGRSIIVCLTLAEARRLRRRSFPRQAAGAIQPDNETRRWHDPDPNPMQCGTG